MLVLKNNYKEILPLFKESLSICDFLAFDCEMTGVTMDLKTDGTKYDTQQFRYYKSREIVKKFDLIQVGVTFYIRREMEKVNQALLNESVDGGQIKEKEEININLVLKSENRKTFYLERTFTFNLFRNSKLRFLSDLYSNDNEMNIFANFTTCHPATLKFLNENGFDLNNIIANGLHHNKLAYSDRISKAIYKHISEGKLPNSVLYLSKPNQIKVIETVKTLTHFLIFGKENQSQGKNTKMDKIMKISELNGIVINYLVSINLKKFLKISGFNLSKDKTDLTASTLIVEKSKVKLNSDEFMKDYQSWENFRDSLTMEMIFKARYSQFIIESKDVESVIEEELGFSKFIELIIQRNSSTPVPIIGHNIFFDLLFIYDKFIDDLPENFYEFKYSLHKYFPIIYDNKFLTTRLAKEIENTKLESLHKSLKKSKYDVYVDIKPDVVNGFAMYADLDSNLSFHNAGFDSMMTGRCFIYLLKAVENNFETENRKGISHQVGKEEIKSVKAVELIMGFLDFNMKNNLLSEFSNKTVLSMIEEPFDICNFDTQIESVEDFQKKEKILETEVFKYVHAVILKISQENSNFFFTIYEFAKLFENSSFNISVIKIHDNVALIEFIALDQNFQSQLELEETLNQVIKTAIENNQEVISNVITYEEFMRNHQNIIKF